jgi:hypothetical protein
MLDKYLFILVYIAVPLTLAFALTMSFIMKDWIAFSISSIGTMIIMFEIGYGHGKSK